MLPGDVPPKDVESVGKSSAYPPPQALRTGDG